MRLIRFGQIGTLAFLVFSAGSATAARPHVHGEGELSIAIESGRVDLSLIAPARDVMNESPEAANERFADSGLFVFVGASCQLVANSVESAADVAAEWAEPDEQDHQAHQQDDPDHHAEHGHEDHDAHSDSLLIWAYQCSENPSQVRVELFERTSLELLRVQAIGDSGARTAELTATSRNLELP